MRLEGLKFNGQTAMWPGPWPILYVWMLATHATAHLCRMCRDWVTTAPQPRLFILHGPRIVITTRHESWVANMV